MRRWARIGLLAAVLMAAAAAPASAQGLGPFGLGALPTSSLPANPANSSDTVHPGFDRCPGGETSCPPEVILEMYERWRPLNARCDHNAVFALTYLRTTEAYARAVAAGYFGDVPWINHEDAVFADFYFRAFDAHAAGQAIPVSWVRAFEAAASSDVTGVGDMFLGMNAHINRDLSYTLAAVGLLTPGGATRKTDHDKVNQFLVSVADPLQEELGRRYDPLFTTTDTPTPLDEQTVLDAVYGFREQAWRNAESYVNAAAGALREGAAASTEAQSDAYANSILAASTIPGYGPIRDAYCRSRLEPSFKVEILDSLIRPVLRRGALELRVLTDGPARVTLSASLVPRGKRSAAPGAKRKRRRPPLVRTTGFETNRSGEHVVALELTKRGKRKLRHRRSARLSVALAAPGPVTAAGEGRLTRKRHRRR